MSLKAPELHPANQLLEGTQASHWPGPSFDPGDSAGRKAVPFMPPSSGPCCVCYTPLDGLRALYTNLAPPSCNCLAPGGVWFISCCTRVSTFEQKTAHDMWKRHMSRRVILITTWSSPNEQTNWQETRLAHLPNSGPRENETPITHRARPPPRRTPRALRTYGTKEPEMH